MQDRLVSTLGKIQSRLERNKNRLPADLLERLEKALTDGVDAEKCVSFLSEIEEIHRQLESAIHTTTDSTSSATTSVVPGSSIARVEVDAKRCGGEVDDEFGEAWMREEAEKEFQSIDEAAHENYRFYYREYARLKGYLNFSFFSTSFCFRLIFFFPFTFSFFLCFFHVGYQLFEGLKAY